MERPVPRHRAVVLEGDDGQLADFASRLTGSGDLYNQRGRRPFSSVNFVTAHDGFTLKDLVSYNHKHNEDNDEDNRDGSDNNLSWNHGVEGPPTIRRSTSCAIGRCATSSPRCCSPRAPR